MSDLTAAEEDSLLAAEYVLGVLDAPDLFLAAARATNDAGFAAEVAVWENLLAPLASLVPAAAPPEELWQRLRRAINGAPLSSNDNFSGNGQAGPRSAEAALTLWRRTAYAAMAIAAGFAVVAVLPRTPRPVAIASLTPLKGAGPAFLIRVLPGGQLAIAAVAPPAIAADRDLELWALPPGATRPAPLGVLPRNGALVAAAGLAPLGGKLLVSLEPKGGSPTGQPTGPVLFGGTITSL